MLKRIDVECDACGARVECWDDEIPECCGATMARVCNGGTKSRWRYCDFSDDPTNYFGQTSHSVHVEDEDTGKPVELLDGGTVEGLPKFTDSDAKSEKRDRAEHAIKQTRGKNPIYVGT